MAEQKKQQPIEKVLSDYVIENANLKIAIAELESKLAEATKSNEEGE